MRRVQYCHWRDPGECSPSSSKAPLPTPVSGNAGMDITMRQSEQAQAPCKRPVCRAPLNASRGCTTVGGGKVMPTGKQFRGKGRSQPKSQSGSRGPTCEGEMGAPGLPSTPSPGGLCSAGGPRRVQKQRAGQRARPWGPCARTQACGCLHIFAQVGKSL